MTPSLLQNTEHFHHPVLLHMPTEVKADDNGIILLAVDLHG